MLSIFNNLFGKLFDVNALAQALTDVDIDVEIANALAGALANNNIELFKDLALKVLSDNKFDMKVKNALLDHCDGCFSGNTLFKFTGTAVGPMQVASLSMICFALIFKEGVPVSLTLFILTIVAVGAMLLDVMKKSVSEFGTAMQYLRTVQQSRSAPKPLELSARELETKNILSIARMSNQLVREDTKRMCEELSKIALMYVVATECYKLMAALKGAISSSTKSLSKDGSMEINKKITEQLTVLQDKMVEIIDFQRRHSSALAKVAKLSQKWGNKFNSCRKSVTSRAKDLPARPDFLCTTKERVNTVRISDSIKEMVEKITDEVNKELDELSQDFDVTYSDDAAKQLTEQCVKLIEVIAFMPQLQKNENVAIKNQLEQKAKYLSAYNEAISKRSQLESIISNLKSNIKANSETYDLRLAQLNSQFEEVKKQLDIQGQGQWTMKGTPPSNDPLAKELLGFWNTKQFSKLYNYSSGSFSVQLDTDLTFEQRKAHDVMKRIIDQIDKVKQDFESSKAVRVWAAELREKEALLPGAIAEVGAAKDQLEKCEREREGSVSWTEFSAKYPIEFSQVSY